MAGLQRRSSKSTWIASARPWAACAARGLKPQQRAAPASERLLNRASPAADIASRALPLVLSLIAGSTDVIGFLGLNGLFTAHITGNLAVLAAHVVAGDPTIFSYVLSVPVFMLVLFLTR